MGLDADNLKTEPTILENNNKSTTINNYFNIEDQDEEVETSDNKHSANNILFYNNRTVNKYYKKAVNLKKYCRNPNILRSKTQKTICLKNIKIIAIMSQAAKLAIEECKLQFKFKPWNCTTFNRSNIYGSITRLKSKENAFLHALNSASAMFQVTRACNRGDLKKCFCNQPAEDKYYENYPNKFKAQTKVDNLGGCFDNVLFGYKLSKKFVDSDELQDKSYRHIVETEFNKEAPLNKKEFKLINLHNNEIGRRVKMLTMVH